MSRWTEFRSTDKRIPATRFEACIFLSNAHRHLSNLPVSWDLLAAREVICDALSEVNRQEADA